MDLLQFERYIRILQIFLRHMEPCNFTSIIIWTGTQVQTNIFGEIKRQCPLAANQAVHRTATMIQLQKKLLLTTHQLVS